MARLLASLVMFGAGSLWARSWAARRFRRRLRCQGVPRELASALAQDYRTAFRWRDLLRGRGGSPLTPPSPP